MPNYSYRCDTCNTKWSNFRLMKDRYEEYCSVCGRKACMDFSVGGRIEVFKPMYFNDLDVEPVWVESKRQLREECKKRNLIAARLL